MHDPICLILVEMLGRLLPLKGIFPTFALS